MYNIFKQYKQVNNYLRMKIKTVMCDWNNIVHLTISDLDPCCDTHSEY